MDMDSPAERLISICRDESPRMDEVKKIISAYPEAVREALAVACKTIRADPVIDSTLIAYLLSEAFRYSHGDRVEQDAILRDSFTQLVRSSKVLVLRHLNKRRRRRQHTSSSRSSLPSTSIMSLSPPTYSRPPPSLGHHADVHPSVEINLRDYVKKYSLAFVAMTIDDDFDMMSTMQYILKIDPTAVKDEKDGDLLIERVVSYHSPRRGVYHLLQLYRLLIDLGVEQGIPKAGLIREKFILENRYHHSPLHNLLTLAPNVLCLHYLQNRNMPLLAPSDVVNFKLLYPAVNALKVDMVQYLLGMNIMGISTMPLLLLPSLLLQSFLSNDPEKIAKCESLFRILVETGIQTRLGGEFGAGGLLIPFDDFGFSIPNDLIVFSLCSDKIDGTSSIDADRPFRPPQIAQDNTCILSSPLQEDVSTTTRSTTSPHHHRLQQHAAYCILHTLYTNILTIDSFVLNRVVHQNLDEMFQRYRIPIIHSVVRYTKVWKCMDIFIDRFPWCVTIEDSGGRLPIHHAIENDVGWVEGTQRLIESCPSTLLKVDHNGRSPLHIIIHALRSRKTIRPSNALCTLLNIVKREPWIVSTIMDSTLGVYPFMYAAAISSHDFSIHSKQPSTNSTNSDNTGWGNAENPAFQGRGAAALEGNNASSSYALDACYILLRACPMLIEEEARAEHERRLYSAMNSNFHSPLFGGAKGWYC